MKNSEQRKAYSYIRYSSGKQALGDSLARQTSSPEVIAFMQEHKLNAVKEMVHSGSSFKGKNFDNKTVLGKFIQDINTGNIETNSVLVLENLDIYP